MPLMRSSLMNRELKNRTINARVTLFDRNGVNVPKAPAPPPPEPTAGKGILLTAQGSNANPVTFDWSPPAGDPAWSGVRVQVEIWAERAPPFLGSTAWSQVLSCPQPLYSPMVPNPPEVYEVRVYVDSAGPRNDLVLVTVLMMDGTAGWHVLCDSVCVALF
jgi:hypothetical protein